MFDRLRAFFRHALLDASDTHRIIRPEALQRLSHMVATSEKGHSGEIRICVEASLPNSYLWRHVWDKVPVHTLTRQRALMMFSKLRVWDTADNNGVLIYLLLAEHKIELVADRGVNAVVAPEEWEAMVRRMGAAFAAGHFEAGLAQAVEEVSAPLQRHFGVQPDAHKRNELPDSPALG